MPFQRAIVIGSSGGIGTALVSSLVKQGSDVTALSRAGLSNGVPARTGPIDIQSEESIERAASAAAPHGPYDLIIVATGILHGDQLAPEKSYRQLSAEVFQLYFAVNATGPALVAKHFLPLLARECPAVFAVLSARVGSISDNRLGGWYGYRASKAALNMIVKTLAIELARTRPEALCVALHPGTVDTALSAPFQRGVPPHRLSDATTSADRLLAVLAGLDSSASGACFAWDGSVIDP